MLAGLETPDSGEVWISGAEATALAPQKRNVGFVFQHYAAFKHMTVSENIGFGLEIRKRPKDEIRRRVSELIDLVQLTGFGDRYPAQLSGGQRQRMALARALAVEPEVLLLDEPFGALDARVRKELRAWLRRLHDEVHVTTVFVTHDQEEAMDVAEQIVVMNAGRVEQVGAPRDLYERPANEFVMTFIGPTTWIDGSYTRPHDLARARGRRRGQGDGNACRPPRLRSARRADDGVGRGGHRAADAGAGGVLRAAVGDEVCVRARPEPSSRSAAAEAQEVPVDGDRIALVAFVTSSVLAAATPSAYASAIANSTRCGAAGCGSRSRLRSSPS